MFYFWYSYILCRFLLCTGSQYNSFHWKYVFFKTPVLNECLHPEKSWIFLSGNKITVPSSKRKYWLQSEKKFSSSGMVIAEPVSDEESNSNSIHVTSSIPFWISEEKFLKSIISGEYANTGTVAKRTQNYRSQRPFVTSSIRPGTDIFLIRFIRKLLLFPEK